MYPSNKKKKVWREEKERLLKMTLEERRKEYIRDYVPLNTIPSWKEEMKGKNQNDEENTQETLQMKKSLSEKVSLYRGDITLLEIDAIVNAACWCAICLPGVGGEAQLLTFQMNKVTREETLELPLVRGK
ncbi:ADP-ribose glycohydrolase MACROD2 isoform X7 [Marmota marmota marmota]|uniref:ADP-ribose glycohydrolase MACROD2 isoform X7 n=1 Tax=Marmota marmota marmota TaxID=9994 RepID=UPI0020934A6A|nr:ADP-ribose glycohydrolase MACROD2 isoform X7 [Marmota marmota marmota]